MAGGGSQTSTEYSQQRYAPWTQQAQQDVAGAGFNMNSPFVYTPAFGIAPQTADQLKAYDLARLSTKSVFESPDLASQAGLLNPQSATAARINAGDIAEYMNPFMDAVVNNTRATMQRDYQDKDAALASSYAARSALGGSGEALARASAARGFNENLANTTSRLRADAYNNAMQAAVQNANFAQQAGLLNARMPMERLQLQDALMNNRQQRELASIAAVLAGGNAQQRFAQSAFDYPFTALDRIAKYIPQVYDTNKVSQKTVEGGDSGIGGILGPILGLAGKAIGLSDDDKKTNAEFIGTEPESGLKVYAADYKADVGKGLPKRITYMASDVEKKYPEAVSRIGKTRVVNYGLLADIVAQKKKAA